MLARPLLTFFEDEPRDSQMDINSIAVFRVIASWLYTWNYQHN